MAEELKTIQVVSDGETYIYRYEKGGDLQVLQQLVADAEDPAHPLTWFTAAHLAAKLGPIWYEKFVDLAGPAGPLPATHP